MRGASATRGGGAAAGDFLMAPCLAWLWLLFFSYLSYLEAQRVRAGCLLAPEEQVVHVVVHLQEVGGQAVVLHLGDRKHEVHGPIT